MDYAKPAPHFLERKGRWLGFKDWPSRKIKTKAMYLSGTSLIERKPRAKSERRSVNSPQTTGMKAQEWCPYGQGRIAAEGATDQREDDAGSLCFDTAPLKSPLHIVGNGFVRLRIAADRKQALAAVRICDVAPDGTSAMVTLRHPQPRASQEPRVPGAAEARQILRRVGAAEIRRADDSERPSAARSPSRRPIGRWCGPSPEDVTLTVDAAQSRLDLPVLGSFAGLGGVKFGPPDFAPDAATTEFEPEVEKRTILNEIETETTTFLIKSDDGRYVINDIGTEQTSTRIKTYRIQRDDPTACFCSVLCTQAYKRGDWDARFDSEVAVTSDATHFHVTAWVKAYDHGKIFATREYREKIKRDCM